MRPLLAGFIQQSHAANGQENDRFGSDACTGADQRMAQFMQQNTAEYQAYQRKNTLGIGGMVGGGFGQPHKRDEK